MTTKKLFIFVEGDDDVRFFDTVIKPKLATRYNSVDVSPYTRLKKKRIANFLKSIKAMNNDYIYVGDINSSPCVSDKKQKIFSKLKTIDMDRIIVVKMEIESWYLAGANILPSNKSKIHPFNITDTVTKEQFNKIIPRSFDSRIDFMSEILKNFSIEKARKKNTSFRYFVDKYITPSR